MADTQRFNEGLACYREGNFSEAIKLFKVCIEGDITDWPAVLYLGMSYCRHNQLPEAEITFRYMLDKCPDSDLRAKAEVALSPIRQAVRNEAAEYGADSQNSDAAWLVPLLKGKKP